MHHQHLDYARTLKLNQIRLGSFLMYTIDTTVVHSEFGDGKLNRYT